MSRPPLIENLRVHGFDGGVRRACDRRDGISDMRSRGYHGPILVEIAYRESCQAFPSGLADIR